MKNIYVASIAERAGKSIAAIAIGLKYKKVGYMKPFGDNPIYINKKIVDYDALLFKKLFDIEEEVEKLSLGIHHSKIIHYYKDISKEIEERYKNISKGKEIFIFEGCENIWKGASIGLDMKTISSKFNAKTIFIITGSPYEIIDKINFINSLKIEDVGIILNRIKKEDIEEMKERIEKIGIEFIGYIPEIKKLKLTKIGYIVEKLNGKVVAGEGGLDKYVENVFIAALSANQIKRHPDFKKRNKLIITGGDRSDAITACIEENTSGIILTNNIIPSSNILAKADREEIPLISVRPDTYTIAKRIEELPKVILPEEKEKIEEIRKKARVEI